MTRNAAFLFNSFGMVERKVAVAEVCCESVVQKWHAAVARTTFGSEHRKELTGLRRDHGTPSVCMFFCVKCDGIPGQGTREKLPVPKGISKRRPLSQQNPNLASSRRTSDLQLTHT